jgi:hypothetical protein
VKAALEEAWASRSKAMTQGQQLLSLTWMLTSKTSLGFRGSTVPRPSFMIDEHSLCASIIEIEIVHTLGFNNPVHTDVQVNQYAYESDFD